MDICYFLLFTCFYTCGGVSLRRQLEHIAERRRESRGITNEQPSRRYFDFHPGRGSTILGAPSMGSHLPAAEPILPGHTLLRPSLDMLRSAVKFPHRDMENGAGVYGNIENLGITYDGTNERVLYTGFRRMEDDEEDILPNDASIEIYSIPSSSLRQNYKFKTADLNSAQSKNEKITRENGALLMLSLDESSGESINNHHEHPDDFDSFLVPKKKQEIQQENYEIDKKRTWFWNSKDSFNHIKINQRAPEINELAPPLKNKKTKRWWYYHEGDFVPFEKMD